MTTHPVVGRRAGTRRGRLALATLGAAVLGASVVASAPAASAQRVAAEAPRVECTPGQSAARVPVGAADGVDPNTLTAAEAQANEAQLDAALDDLAPGTLSKARRQGTVIKTYFHVITRKDGSGGVTQEQIDAQMSALNAGYAGTTASGAAATGFSFELAGVDVTRNTKFYNWGNPQTNPSDDRLAKKKLHKGGWATLNVYVAKLDDDLLGYATFPRKGSLARDGVVVTAASLPGQVVPNPYALGDTLTHEVGHWLNLYHTFQGSCSKKNDRVKDTPAQRAGENIYGCNEADDTCKAPGTDPVHNFMSYGDDECLDAFTSGQAARMTKSFAALRAPKG